MPMKRFFPWLMLVAIAPVAMLAHGCSSDETSNPSGPGGNTAGNGGTGAVGGGGSGAAGGVGGGGGTGGVGNTGGGEPTEANCDPPSGTPGNLQLTMIASGLDTPLMLTYSRGDNDRLYVIEQGGTIRLIKGGQLQATPFLDISNIVSGGGEQGLLGLAFHPNYATNGRFFVHYTSTPDGDDAAIAEYRRDPNNPDLADPTMVQKLIVIPDFAGNHNGGSLEFSPIDGFLYLGMGDGGGGGDPQENGQDPTDLHGKLLRIDVDGAMPYAIPAGNLQDTEPGAAPEVFDWGLRNPYRWNFDVCTGDRYIGDVGQNAWEEVDVALASAGPTNWGWDDCEGTHDFEGNGCPDPHEPPVAEYPHQGDPLGCGYSVLGGHVYRGSAIPWLRGTYFYTEYCGGRTWTLHWANGQLVDGPTDITTDLITDYPTVFLGYGFDNRGEMYLCNADGTIYRIDAE
jgi:glucose/arabinose dehydrogenase